MNQNLILRKATRIEGNADIHIEYEDNRLKSARFQIYEFRGFEKFISGRRAEWVPHLISRICGLCSVAHQVAGIRAVEDAMGIEVDSSTNKLRDIRVLAEWISSHSLSYFFLTVPDFVDEKGGVFALQQTHPKIFKEAFEMRQAAMKIVTLFGKRETHPVTIGLGRFLDPPGEDVLNRALDIAAVMKEKLRAIIIKVSSRWRLEKAIEFPEDLRVHFVALSNGKERDDFSVFDRKGQLVRRFSVDEFEENIEEMRVDWSLSKIPYIRSLGFPDGIMLVGPLSRSFLENGFLADPEIRRFGISDILMDRSSITLESYDLCRLLEMYWSAKRIVSILKSVGSSSPPPEPDWSVAGQGIGALEAPRGLLIHKYLIKHGCVEKVRLLVATQFNNAFINLLITDLAQRHSRNGQITKTGSRLIGRCIRLLDPCLSCATQ